MKHRMALTRISCYGGGKRASLKNPEELPELGEDEYYVLAINAKYRHEFPEQVLSQFVSWANGKKFVKYFKTKEELLEMLHRLRD